MPNPIKKFVQKLKDKKRKKKLNKAGINESDIVSKNNYNSTAIKKSEESVKFKKGGMTKAYKRGGSLDNQYD
tara:strand:- start:2921 stop:3136 length:216 start_codon:yes stop_codon:yes gene_type:complete